ncbi:MAG TPA: histidine kinase, partial [Sphingomonas sp.]|nr:histidine kinase [Sphingomonas sp.]
TDVLTATAWQSATFHDVVKAGLTSVDGMADRITIDGPAVRLDAQLALALTLALHELVTNAFKYGALSNDIGKVSLVWRYAPPANGADGRFRLTWQEHDGPPVTPPTREGFGSRMIQRTLQSYFRGDTSLDYAPTGVTFRIDAPLPQDSADLNLGEAAGG